MVGPHQMRNFYGRHTIIESHPGGVVGIKLGQNRANGIAQLIIFIMPRDWRPLVQRVSSSSSHFRLP